MGEGAPSALTIAKIGVETGYGAGVPTLNVPITGGNIAGLYDPVLDQGLRGVAARDFGSYKGPARAEGSIEGFAYKAVIDILKASIIGSGGSLSSSPATLAYQISAGSGSVLGKGLGVTELTIRFNRAEGALTYSASMLGQKAVSAGPLGVAHQVGKPPMGWRAAISIGSLSGSVVEGEWSLSREWALLYSGTGADAAFATNAYAGPLEVTARFTVDFSASADLDAAINKAQGSVTTAFSDEDGANTITIGAPKMDFADGPMEIDFSGTFVTLVYSCRALYDTASGTGPVSIT